MAVKIGNWFFHFRNMLFPVFYAVLFIPSPEIFPDPKWSVILGGSLIFLGMGIRCLTVGLAYVVRGGEARRIHANFLVTEGIYRLCRNPLYLGNITLIIGFGIFANSLLFLLCMVPLFIGIYLSIILAEEDYLTKKFDTDYINYKMSTNALLPKLGEIGNAFSGTEFSFKRVITKEYNSMFLYSSGVLLLLWYRYGIEWQHTALIFGLLVILYALVKVLKKAKII
jgi:protein-S-isoprenylcysteine O-methyltransferase Ste14